MKEHGSVSASESLAETFLNEIVIGAIAVGAGIGAAVTSAIRGIRGRGRPHKRRPSPSVVGAEVEALHARVQRLEAEVQKLHEERAESGLRIQDSSRDPDPSPERRRG